MSPKYTKNLKLFTYILLSSGKNWATLDCDPWYLLYKMVAKLFYYSNQHDLKTEHQNFILWIAFIPIQGLHFHISSSCYLWWLLISPIILTPEPRCADVALNDVCNKIIILVIHIPLSEFNLHFFLSLDF